MYQTVKNPIDNSVQTLVNLDHRTKLSEITISQLVVKNVIPGF